MCSLHAGPDVGVWGHYKPKEMVGTDTRQGAGTILYPLVFKINDLSLIRTYDEVLWYYVCLSAF